MSEILIWYLFFSKVIKLLVLKLLSKEWFCCKWRSDFLTIIKISLFFFFQYTRLTCHIILTVLQTNNAIYIPQYIPTTPSHHVTSHFPCHMSYHPPFKVMSCRECNVRMYGTSQHMDMPFPSIFSIFHFYFYFLIPLN